MTNSPIVSCALLDKVATVTLQREKSLNALDDEVLTALSEVMHGLAVRDIPKDDCRVVVLRGAGERAFVAGADIRAMQRADDAAIRQFVYLGQRVMREVELCPCPVVAVVHGVAYGGGLELALAADIIVAAETAKLGQPEVKLGLIPGFGGSQRLVLRVGAGRARLMVLTGDEVTGAEAHRIGLVDAVSPSDQLDQLVASIVGSLVARGPLAVRAAKRVIRSLHEDAELAGLGREAEQFLHVFESADAREGLKAFVEKRPAVFRGE